MIRKIINISEEKCNGCGKCVQACHEGAICMINGKAKLIRDDYCDGLGDCLPACPANAITFEEREALEYNEEAVKIHQKNISNKNNLIQWPVQIKLIPVKAPYYENADLLIAADCTAYAYNNFHSKFINKNITIIGCPKLDMIDYSEKLCEIIKSNNIKYINIVRMEVPCCSGIEIAVKNAIKNSNKLILYKVTIISVKGEIIN